MKVIWSTPTTAEPSSATPERRQQVEQPDARRGAHLLDLGANDVSHVDAAYDASARSVNSLLHAFLLPFIGGLDGPALTM